MKKALDVNFNLPLSKEDTGRLYRNITSLLSSRMAGMNANTIADDAEIISHEVTHGEDNNHKELLRIMRTANREDVFIYLNRVMTPLIAVEDYKVISINPIGYDRRDIDNPTIAMKVAAYILQMKPDELSKNNELSVSRLNQPRTQQMEREKLVMQTSRQERQLIEKIRDAKKAVLGGLRDSEMIDAYKVKIGDRIRTRGSDEEYKEVDSIVVNPASRGISFKFTDNTESQEYRSYVRVQRDLEDERSETFDMISQIDFVELARKGQSYPQSIINSLPMHVNTYSIERLYSQFVDLLNSKYSVNTDMRDKVVKNLVTRAKKGLVDDTYNLTYRDRSGYMVDLSKYLTQIKVDDGVPKYIKDSLSNLQTKVNDAITNITRLIIQYANEGNYPMVNRLSDLANRMSLSEKIDKYKHDDIKRLLDENSYTGENGDSFRKSATMTTDSYVKRYKYIFDEYDNYMRVIENQN